ncbi:GGDEF domain-containing protein [Arthrobacter sp. M4]|uniref:GGDEF domain-containing protein n=1 Tax=Arthrobacter sp. M4 TaxID=218160 RepID=UPI001CDBF40C|nr:GGDEF domain-containing protein [Arthrobacter sp. M4]MCA4134523.1 GGDEF domain-containing protein [Arthrobacter sp. M4]
MTLDTASLRVAFAVVALTLCLLFYFAAFRGTRSAYSAWWCVALTLFLTGSAAYLLNGTDHQVWANPLGNFLLVAGGSSVWAGARSLRKVRQHMWFLPVPAVITVVVSAFDSPASNTWSGGAIFLAFMSTTIGLAARELWQLEAGFSQARIPMAVAAGLMSTYYFGRFVTFVIQGPNSPAFTTFFGSAVTTLVTMALLAVVSFSMSALSSEQQNRDLRVAASRDGLTGLLNRQTFLERAASELNRLREDGIHGTLILADLDHFKSVNDTYGHAAGDSALKIFANACQAAVRSTDLVGRYGGEEFIMLLPGANPYRATLVAHEISADLERAKTPNGFRMPTASYGIVSLDSPRAELRDFIASADAALYKAKSQGRNRAILGGLLSSGRATSPNSPETRRPPGSA